MVLYLELIRNNSIQNYHVVSDFWKTKFYFQHFILVCFYFLGEKLGAGGARPSPRPILLLRPCIFLLPISQKKKNNIIHRRGGG